MFRIGLLFTLSALTGYYWRDVVDFVALFQGWYAFALLPLAVVCVGLFISFWALALCLDEEMREETKTNMADATRHYWDN